MTAHLAPLCCYLVINILKQCSAQIPEAYYITDECVRCDDFGRVAGKANCPKSAQDCGDCLPGLKQLSWDYQCEPIRKSVQPALIEQPSDVQVKLKQSVLLPCKWQVAVKCQWIRKGKKVHINKRHYSYIAEPVGGGNLRTDCTLKISSVKKSDRGPWQCGIAETKLKSDPAVVVIMKPPIGAPKIFLDGKPVTEVREPFHVIGPKLSCTSTGAEPAPVMYWMLDNDVRIDGDSETKGSKRKGQITSLTWREDFDWNIRGIAKSTRVQCVLEHPLSKKPLSSAILEFPRHSLHVRTTVGANIMLPCKMDTMTNVTNCDWLRNGQPTKIKGRYKFSKPAEKKIDCSIEIEPVIEIDAGIWKCGAQATSDGEGSNFAEFEIILKSN